MRRAKLQVDGIGVSLESMGPCGQSNQIMNMAQRKRERVRRKIEAIPDLVTLAAGISSWGDGALVDKECASLIARANLILKQIDGVKDEVL